MRFLKSTQYHSVANSADVFNEDEAASIIGFKHKGQWEDGRILSSKLSAYRLSKVTWLQSDDPDVSWVYQRLSGLAMLVNDRFFQMDLTYFEPLQLTEYDASYAGHFDQHIDVEYGYDVGDVRKLSITVQLSKPENYEGGALKMFPARLADPLIADKKIGSAVVFRSNVIHEVEPVTAGTRYSLVAWVHGPLPR